PAVPVRAVSAAGGQPPGPARRLRAEARHLPVVVPAASWRIQRIRSAAAWGVVAELLCHPTPRSRGCRAGARCG
ncbi:MAG TPA: hypothetical protein VGA04_23390, partial [Streptosporangiaceae bacterium]